MWGETKMIKMKTEGAVKCGQCGDKLEPGVNSMHTHMKRKHGTVWEQEGKEVKRRVMQVAQRLSMEEKFFVEDLDVGVNGNCKHKL